MAKAQLATAISVLNGGKASHVTIKMNGFIFAPAKLGGRWDERNALRELATAPQRFVLAPKFASLTPDNIRSLVS